MMDGNEQRPNVWTDDRSGHGMVSPRAETSSHDGVGFGSAIEAGAAGAVRNGDWRCNRLGDPEIMKN